MSEHTDHDDVLIKRKYSVEASPVAQFFTREGLHLQVRAIEQLQEKFVGTVAGDLLSGVSLIGSGKVMLVVLVIFFWYLRPNSWGPTRAASVVLSMVGIAKALLKGPRPYWVSQTLKTLDPTLEVSFGFPSGHTAAVAATYGFIAVKEGMSELLFAFILLVVVGVSRVYTAAHFFHDVAGGALLGLFVLVFLVTIDGMNLGHTTLAAFSLVLSVITFGVVTSQYDSKSIPFKLVQEGLSGSGFLLGLGISHLCEEFIAKSMNAKRGPLPLLACILGILGIVNISNQIKKVQGMDENLTISVVVQCCILYALINVWSLWLLPLLVDQILYWMS